MTNVDETWTPEQCAEFLSLSVRTLRRWRANGCGPPYSEISDTQSKPRVRYLQRDVVAWLEMRRTRRRGRCPQ